MKNSDKPINPITNQHYSTGLTKREYFAGLFIQGEISNNGTNWSNEKHLVQRGLLIADELLKQLDETK
jgi:hypothetical protein